MAFGISTRDTLAIRSFDQAEHLFNTTKEIRGQNKFDVGVPLQYSRRDWKHKALVKIDDNTYAAKLYNTNVIRWHRDGRIVVDMSYGSVSTNTFANYFLHTSRMRVHAFSERSVIQVPTSELTAPLAQRVEREGGGVRGWCNFAIDGHIATLRQDDTRHVEISPISETCKAYVDKSKASGVRKQFAPMMDYLKMFEAYPLEHYESILDEYAREENLRSSYSARAHVMSAIVLRPDDESLWAVLAAAFHDKSYRWYNGSYGNYLRFGGVKEIKRAIYPMAYERAGIYEFKPLPFGTLTDGWRRNAN